LALHQKPQNNVGNNSYLKLNRAVGFKASGGIRTLSQAESYDNWLMKLWERIGDSQTFRIGASSLMNEIQKYLKD
jgi:deoxyribose-phosphate aldolase